jgi:hypothetical protein
MARLGVAWFLLLTVVNQLNWRFFACEWSRPYGATR